MLKTKSIELIYKLRESLPWERFIHIMQEEGFHLVKKMTISSMLSEHQLFRSGFLMLVDNYIESSTIHDASHLHLLPKIVFHPKKCSQLQTIIINAQNLHIPVTFAGGKTGLSASYANFGIIVDLMDLSYSSDPIKIDIVERTVSCNQNVLISDLIKSVDYFSNKELMFPVQPSSAFKLPVTVGGIIGTNASGVTSGKLGPTSEWLLEVIILNPAGEIMHITKDNHLFKRILAGNGYYGVVLHAKFRLFKSPQNIVYSVLSGTNEVDAYQRLQEIQDEGVFPIVAEFVISRNGLPGKFKELAVSSKLSEDAILTWAVLIKDEEDIVLKFEEIMKQQSSININRVAEVEFSQYLEERASMALMSMSNGNSDDILRFPGFEDTLIPPKLIPQVLHKIDEIVGKHGFNNVSIGYGHLNFRKGQGCLMHARLPVLISQLLNNKQQYLDIISETITDVVFTLRRKYNVNAKAEHSPGSFGIWLDEKTRSLLSEDIYQNLAFFNPHLMIFDSFKENFSHPNEVEDKDKYLFNRLLRTYLKFGT